MQLLGYGFLALFGILILLLLLPAKVYLYFKNADAQVYAGILGIKIRVWPRKEQKKHSDKPVETGNQKDADDREKMTISEQISMIRTMLDDLLSAAGRLIQGIKISDLSIDAVASDPDPAKTALMYGSAAASVGMLLPVLESTFRIQQKKIHVNADFEAGKSSFSLRLILSVLIFKALLIGIRVFLVLKKNLKHKAV